MHWKTRRNLGIEAYILIVTLTLSDLTGDPSIP